MAQKVSATFYLEFELCGCIFANLIDFFFLIRVEQALGIKGKMIAKKNYSEKAQMKKT